MPVYFPAFAGTKLYCLVTEGVNNLPKVVAQQRRGRASNPRLLDRKSDALPLSHRATIIIIPARVFFRDAYYAFSPNKVDKLCIFMADNAQHYTF